MVAAVTEQTPTSRSPWYGRIGPAFITAAVVLGPGSIVASSRAGAEAGYGMVWLLLAACFLMMTFTYMGARIGCALSETPLGYVAERWGRPVALIVGLSAFLVTSGFQFGNNIGVSVSVAELTATAEAGEKEQVHFVVTGSGKT